MGVKILTNVSLPRSGDCQSLLFSFDMLYKAFPLIE